MRTKCVTILSYLSRIRLEPILPLIPTLEKQQSDGYWELKGQILILASNALVQFNTQELEPEGNAQPASSEVVGQTSAEQPNSQPDEANSAANDA